MLLHGGDGWGISPERDEALWRGLIAAQKAGPFFFLKKVEDVASWVKMMSLFLEQNWFLYTFCLSTAKVRIHDLLGSMISVLFHVLFFTFID